MCGSLGEQVRLPFLIVVSLLMCLRQEADLAKEQGDAQRELQEWSARAQCAAIDALSPQQVPALDHRHRISPPWLPCPLLMTCISTSSPHGWGP